MESDTKSRYSTVGSCSDNGAELAYDYWFHLGLENSLTETLRENTRGRVYQAFPPPPPPPTRESSVSLGESLNTPGDLKSAVSSRKGTIPYKLPDIKACTVLAAGTSFMRSSGIRETLPRIRKLQVRKQPHIPLADILLSSEITTDTTKQPLGLGKLSNDTERHEEDAARALLVLRQCSLKMAEMTKTWSHPSRVPLCDFIVAQKKCQVILEGIETLKDARVQVREATAVGDVHENDKLMRYAKEKQRYKDRHKSFSRTFSSRSSSIISVVNVITNEKGSGARSKSTSSERTTTKSPTESSRDMSHLTTPASTSIYEDPGRGSRSSLEDCKKILGKIGKTSKSGKNRNTHMKCLQCSATDTPEWRKGPVGPTTLCNACGLFYKKLLKRFGGDTAGVIMRMRQNENPRDRKVPRSISS